MAVQSLSLKTVHLVADTVWTGLSLSHSDGLKIQSCYALLLQVIMLGKDGDLKDFNSLGVEDKDLTVFTIENLVLSEDKNRILMKIVLKRKITTEMLTTFLPTILLLLITFTSILFDKELFGDALAVNLTIMLVMTTIFTSKIEELPPTSDMKMIDIWLIFCLVVPFLEVILRTAMECNDCSCGICDPKDTKGAREGNNEKDGKGVQGGSSSEAAGVWVETAKVAPEQVYLWYILDPKLYLRQDLRESYDKKSTGLTETSNKVEEGDSEARGLKKIGVRAPGCRKGSLKRGLKYTGEHFLICIASIEDNH